MRHVVKRCTTLAMLWALQFDTGRGKRSSVGGVGAVRRGLEEQTIIVSGLNGDDDGQQEGRNFDRDESTIDIASEGSGAQGAGFRFPGINIPQRANIISAILTVTAEDSTGDDETIVEIAGQDVDNAEPFESEGILALPRTESRIFWSIPAFEDDESFDSDDLAAIIQEIVDRDGWVPNNAIALLFGEAQADSARRRPVLSFDGGDERSRPFLTIKFEENQNNNAAAAAVAVAAIGTVGFVAFATAKKLRRTTTRLETSSTVSRVYSVEPRVREIPPDPRLAVDSVSVDFVFKSGKA